MEETGGFQRGHFKSAVADVKCGPVVCGGGIPDVGDNRDPDFIAQLLHLSTIDGWGWIIFVVCMAGGGEGLPCLL